MANQNNTAYICGRVTQPTVLSHQVQGESFYRIIVEVPRRSGTQDRVPVVFGGYTINPQLLQPGQCLRATGQVRTYSRVEQNQRKLHVVLFAQHIQCTHTVAVDSNNAISLTGRLCNPPVYRQTPLGRQITDLLVTVQRGFDRSDYIPCIAWGNAARYCAGLQPRQGIQLVGRFQSREYVKRLSDSVQEVRTAYEVSILRVSAF